MRPRDIAQRRKIAATRLAEGGVWELSRRPPETLLLGANVSQEVKCFAVGQRLMSVPISATICSAACGPMQSIWLRSAPPVSRCSGAANIEGGGMLPGYGLAPWRGQCGGGWWLLGGERVEQRLDLGVAFNDLVKVELVSGEVLAQ